MSYPIVSFAYKVIRREKGVATLPLCTWAKIKIFTLLLGLLQLLLLLVAPRPCIEDNMHCIYDY